MCVPQFAKVDFDQPRVRDNWEEVDVGRVRLSGSIAYTAVPSKKSLSVVFLLGGSAEIFRVSGSPVEKEDYIPVRRDSWVEGI